METFWNWKSVEYSCFWYVNIRNIRNFFFNIQDKILVILFHWMRNDDSKIKYNESEREREQSITINNNKIKQVNSYYCESVIFQYYSFFLTRKIIIICFTLLYVANEKIEIEKKSETCLELIKWNDDDDDDLSRKKKK